VTIKEAPKVAPRIAPGLGEHTDQVLEQLGFNAGQSDGVERFGSGVMSQKQKQEIPEFHNPRPR